MGSAGRGKAGLQLLDAIILHVINKLNWSGCCEPDRPHYPRVGPLQWRKRPLPVCPLRLFIPEAAGRRRPISCGGVLAIACMDTLSVRSRYTTPKTRTFGLQRSSTVGHTTDTAIEQGNARCQAAITVLYSHHQTAIREVVSTMRLEGKVALISGGARGQGATEARLFAREGAKVVIGDLLEEEGKQVEAEINASGGACLFVKLDVTKAEDWQHAVEAAVARFGTLNVLVNNAGIGSTRGPDGEPVTLEHLTEEQWDRVMEVNAKGVFLGTKYAIPAMRQAGGGSIINISSIAGIVGGQTTAYGASKGAVRLLTKATAIQYAREGIRCNSVHPGVIETPMTARMLAREEGRQRSIARHPLGRLGQPEDVAYGVLYLAADESSFVTGSELVIDGGLTAQ